ncbi:MAG: VOC family protein [Dehalococcoidales bacterium]|jgi:PhnB protein
MMKINLGLRFPGTCEEAFEFYRSVFGGELIKLQRYKEMREHGYEVAAGDENKLAFVGLALGENMLLGGDDYTESSGQQYIQGNNCTIEVRVDTKEEADRVFHALSAGGVIKMPLGDVYWGEYCGYFTDKFGVSWGVTCHCSQAA